MRDAVFDLAKVEPPVVTVDNIVRWLEENQVQREGLTPEQRDWFEATRRIVREMQLPAIT